MQWHFITIHRKFLAGEKLVNLVNHKLFTKMFIVNIHRYTNNVFGICTDDCNLFAKFFLANNFYLYGHDHPCIVYCSSRVVACILKKISYVSESAGTVLSTQTHIVHNTPMVRIWRHLPEVKC